MTILNVNCQSVNAKKHSFNNIVYRVSPDIVVGTESWLDGSIKNKECFPEEDYEVIRRDRETDKHGGVFIMVKRDLIMERVYDLETDCEIIWCKINMVRSKSIYICSYYRPHENDEPSLKELEKE